MWNCLSLRGNNIENPQYTETITGLETNTLFASSASTSQAEGLQTGSGLSAYVAGNTFVGIGSNGYYIPWEGGSGFQGDVSIPVVSPATIVTTRDNSTSQIYSVNGIVTSYDVLGSVGRPAVGAMVAGKTAGLLTSPWNPLPAFQGI